MKIELNYIFVYFSAYSLSKKAYPVPVSFQKKITKNKEGTVELFRKAASDKNSPLYVLIWGYMINFGEAIRLHPELASKIRVISIATDLMMEKYNHEFPADWDKTGVPCTHYNWNGWGRNQLIND